MKIAFASLYLFAEVSKFTPPRRDAQLRGTKAVGSDREAGALANRRAADRYFMRYRIQRVRARLLGQDKRHAVSASPPPPRRR